MCLPTKIAIAEVSLQQTGNAESAKILEIVEYAESLPRSLGATD
jgi:hypothetical protein